MNVESESECESDLVVQLRKLAGGQAGENKFTVVVDDVKVFVEYWSGSGSHVSFATAYGQATPKITPPSAEGGYRAKPTSEPTLRATRPMMIALRDESPADVDAKESGVSVEFQTGDHDFDSEVYVDTHTPHEVLAHVLGSKALRDAVRTLRREGITRLVLDDAGSMISCSLYTFAHAKHDDARASRIVKAIATMARETPRVEDNGELPPKEPHGWLDWIAAAGGFILFFGAPIYMALVPSRCWDDSSDGEGKTLVCRVGCCEPMWQGLLLGILVSLPLATIVPRLLRGRSNSHTRRALVGGSIVWFATTMTMCLFGILRWHLS
ncbi:MAG: hypothetical protein JNK05_01515 [Myxococcales bacterium]|nr:hypothetical protein [Myxococcales bacterium]